jgi:hypothetical protein
MEHGYFFFAFFLAFFLAGMVVITFLSFGG